MSNRDVAITGSGMIASGGVGSEQVWQSILYHPASPESRVYQMGDGSELEYPVYQAPKVNPGDWLTPFQCEWWKEEGIYDDPDFTLMMAAARMALEDAGIRESERESVALVIGHENLGMNRLIDGILTSTHHDGNRHPLHPITPLLAYEAYQERFYKLQTFPYLFYLSKTLHLGGIGYVTNNACATGLYAMELGSQLIRSGQADIVLVVCSDYAHVTEHLWLANKGFGSEKQSLRPFDLHRDGSILGDGAAAVVLESSERIQSKSSKPMYRYAGSAFKQDRWQMTLPDVTSHAYSRVMELANSRWLRAPVDLLVPHGTGNTLWDRYEAMEIKRAFTDLPAITAFKGYIGHTLGANSLIESILLLKCLEHQIIPRTANYEHPDPQIHLPILADTVERPIKRVMKSVPAYGGFIAASAFELL